MNGTLSPLAGCRWTRIAVIAMALLVVATGFCLFDVHDDKDHAVSMDLCLGLIVGPAPVVLVAPLSPAGRAAAFVSSGLPASAVRIPSPPPKLSTPA